MGQPTSFYDVGQVCTNGHVVNGATRVRPEENRKFCPICGSSTIVNCPSCNASIEGTLVRADGWIVSDRNDPPAYCHNCGKAFPWTESKIQAAIELFADQVQDEAERKQFAESVKQIAQDTPQAQVAASRLRKTLGKLASGAGEVIKKIVVEVAASAVKGSL